MLDFSELNPFSLNKKHNSLHFKIEDMRVWLRKGSSIVKSQPDYPLNKFPVAWIDKGNVGWQVWKCIRRKWVFDKWAAEFDWVMVVMDIEETENVYLEKISPFSEPIIGEVWVRLDESSIG